MGLEPEPKLDGILIAGRMLGPRVDGRRSPLPHIWSGYDLATLQRVVVKGSRAAERPSMDDLLNEHDALTAVHDCYRSMFGKIAPNIIPVHSLRETSDAVYLVTPYYESENVFRDRQTGAIIQLGINMLDKLAIVHIADRSHNDAKLMNWIMNGDLVLFDFDLASPSHLEPPITGCPIGTVGYSSPQMLMCGRDPRADVYTVGANMYRLLAGAPPSTPLQWQLKPQHWDLNFATQDVITMMLDSNWRARPSLIDSRNMLAASIGLPESTGLRTGQGSVE